MPKGTRKQAQMDKEAELMKIILEKQNQIKYIPAETEDDDEEEEYELGPSKEVVEQALSKAEKAERKIQELEERLAEKERKELEKAEKMKAEKEEKMKVKMGKKQEKEMKQKEQEEILKALQQDYQGRSERLKTHQALMGHKRIALTDACKF